MGRLAQNRVQVCDYGKPDQYTVQSASVGQIVRMDENVMRKALLQLKEKEALAWDNNVNKTDHSLIEFKTAQEALNRALAMLSLESSSDRITEAIITSRQTLPVVASDSRSVYHELNKSRSNDKTIVQSKRNGTSGTEFRFEGDGLMNNAIPTPIVFKVILNGLWGKGNQHFSLSTMYRKSVNPISIMSNG
jgi:hypothetical protein